MDSESRAYSIIRSRVSDPRRFENFRHVQAKLREAFGGRYLAQTREIASIAGAKPDCLLTLVEYPSIGRLRQKLATYEHTVLHDSLVGAGTDDVWIAPGIGAATPDLDRSRLSKAYLLVRIGEEPSSLLARLMPEIRTLAASRHGKLLVDTDRVETLAGLAGPQHIFLVEFPSTDFLSDALAPTGLRDQARTIDPEGRAEICAVPGIVSRVGPE